MPEPSVSPIAIYQLRVVLRGVSPLIWRRLLVVSETSLGELHEILRELPKEPRIGVVEDCEFGLIRSAQLFMLVEPNPILLYGYCMMLLTSYAGTFLGRLQIVSAKLGH